MTLVTQQEMVAKMFPHLNNVLVYDPETNVTTIYDAGKRTCSFTGLAPTNDATPATINLLPRCRAHTPVNSLQPVQIA